MRYRSPGILATLLFVAVSQGTANAASAGRTEGDVSSLGARIYTRDCAVCHGGKGDGAGVAAARLTVKPRDFRTGQYKFRSTASGQPPTDADLERSIVHGLPGTSMVPQNHLSEAEVAAVIAVIRAFAAPPKSPPRPLTLPRKPDTPSDPERGKRIYHDAGCDGCHGVDGKGDGAVAKDLSQAPADLTRRPLKGGSQPRDILRAVVTGLDGTPMPSYHLLFDDADMWALADYVASLGGKPEPNEEEGLGWEIEKRDPNTGRPLIGKE